MKAADSANTGVKTRFLRRLTQAAVASGMVK
jgi:hypothetical protein